MAKIVDGKFNESYSQSIADDKSISEWPVVYILNNEREAYVGETVNMSNRAAQHWENPERKVMEQVHVISDPTFNKSAILDLESYLIKYMSADGKYTLQNGNGGISNHNYYDREKYEAQFDEIWQQLQTGALAQNSISQIENSDLFKYSPYKSLSSDQMRALYSILSSITADEKAGRNSTTMVNGGPGTGKTVLAIYMLKLLADNTAYGTIFSDNDDFPEDIKHQLTDIGNTLRGLKIGLVIPQQSLRTTLIRVSGKVRNLKPSMILKPTQLGDEMFDILLVDEGHRLRRRWALSQYPAYDKVNQKLGLPEEGTELDWIKKSSKHQVIFYDARQSVRPSDVPRADFIELRKTAHFYNLETQFRCKAGEKYITYISDIFSEFPPEDKRFFPGYDLKMFDDPNEMINAIRKKNEEVELARTVAGYAWKWLSKNDKSLNDFDFSGKKYQWNTTATDWVNTLSSQYEIGCIHTIQGYDLNYVGVIIGNDLKYRNGKLVADKANCFDPIATKVGNNPDLLREQILNVYYTLMTRGIMGTYVYVCDDELREYLRKYL